jgi:hypothetical protein
MPAQMWTIAHDKRQASRYHQARNRQMGCWPHENPESLGYGDG